MFTRFEKELRPEMYCFNIRAFGKFNFTYEVFYLIVSHADKLEELDSCSETCKYLWDGFGQWKNVQWMPYLKGRK